MATDLPTLNLDELDYDDDVIEDKPTSIKSRSRESTPDRKSEKSDDGEISASDDGEIKSESEDGEIDDSDGEVIDNTEEPSIFPKKKKPDLPPLRENNTHIEREKPLCRYYKQGYCQYGNRCHFLHTRPNLVNIVPDQEEKINTGNYELFKKEEVTKVTRRITPIHPAKSDHIGLHRPPPPKPTGETSWEQGIKKARKNMQRREQIKRGEIPPAADPDPDDTKNGNAQHTRTVVHKSRRAQIVRVASQSPESDITRELDIYKKSKSKKDGKEKRWDRAQNFSEEHRKSKKPNESSDSDSSTSSSSSSSGGSTDSFTSESSGRKTPKGYRRNPATHRRSSSEDEDYRRTKRLEEKAKTITSKKNAKADYRSSSSSSKKKATRRKRQTSSSSSSSSSESDSSSDHSSRSEKKRIKLQKQLKQVEAALKAKRGKNRKK